MNLYPNDQEALNTFKKLYDNFEDIADKINQEYCRRQNLYESFLKCKNNILEFIGKYKNNVVPDLFILNPQTILDYYSKDYQICEQLDKIDGKLNNDDKTIIKEFLELYTNFNGISTQINRLFVENLYDEWKKSKSRIVSFCNDYKFNIDYNNPIDDKSKKTIISEVKNDYEGSKKLKKYANLQDYKLNDVDNELLENFIEIYENFNEIIEDINNEYSRILKTQQLFKHNISGISNFISKYKTNVPNDLYIDDYLTVLKENKHYFDICNDLKTISESRNYVIGEDKNVLINFIKIYDNFKNVSSQINEAYAARKYNEYLAYKPKINSINSKFKNLDAKLYIENKNDFVEDNVHINNLLTELIKIKKDLNKSDLTLIKDFLRIFNEFNGGFVSEISESFKNNKHVLTKIINKFTVNLSFDEYIWDKNEHIKQYNKQITLVNNSDVLNKNNEIELSKSDIITIENFMDLIDNFDEVILKNNEGYVEKIKLEFLDKKDQISNFTKQYNDKSVVDDYITDKMKNKIIKQYSDLNNFLLDINSIPEFINQSKKRDLNIITKFLDTYANFDEIIFKINKRYVNGLYKENKDYISQYSKTNELRQDFYISNMKLTELLKYHKETYSIVKKLQNYCLDYEYLNDTTLLESFPKSTRRIKNHYKEANDAFVKKELRYKKKFFNNINGLSLDDQQREAVIIDEDTTHIIAGAGTGKTLTLQAKIKYLIEKRKVKPDEIIALSYSNASVSDLKSKIDDDIDIRTIHSLGNHILEENGEEPNADDEAINRVIDDYFLNKVLKNEEKAQRIVDFYSYFRYPPIDLDKISTKGELYDKEAGRDFESLKSKSFNVEYSESYVTYKREYVKSLEELYIANFLYIHGVEYEYERIYKIKSDEYHCLKEFIYSTSELPVKEMNALINQIADEFDINDEFKPEDMTYIRYKPDFYLPEYGIYLEHFGVDRNCQANWLNPDDARKYHESLIWKRSIHKKYGTKLLETYSYYQKENRLLTRLEEKLKKECVSFNPISYQEIYQRLIDNDNLNKLIDLIKLIKTFINHFKGNNLDKSEFKKIKKLKEENEFVKTRHTILYNIIKDVYDLYQKYLKDKHLIDFNDMINQACESIEQKGCPITYKYILVDEYQDVSYMRYSLLKAIQDDINSKIVVVGDDWQSIYRFSGCDVGLFSKINNYYEHVETRLIETTYRNSQELIDISGYFVMKNAEQIPKELTSEKSIENPIKIAYFDSDPEEIFLFKKIIDRIITSEEYDGSEILVLGRNRRDIQRLVKGKYFPEEYFTYHGDIDANFQRNKYVKVIYKNHEDIKIKFRTIHGSKGLEASNVIVINLKNGFNGFPNKIEDDPILSYVKLNDEEFEFAEERRLFYVALTRTKGNCYLLSPELNKSEFIEELEDIDENIEYIHESFLQEILDTEIVDSSKYISYPTKMKCPECKTGDVILKFNNENSFLTCSQNQCDWVGGNFSGDFEDLDQIFTCPQCGDMVVKRIGQYGSFFSCTNSNCNYTLDDFSDPAYKEYKIDLKCPICETDLSVMYNTEYENGSIICHNCNYNGGKFFQDVEDLEIIGICPKCQGVVIKKNGIFGEFKGCARWRRDGTGCDYTANFY